VVALVATKPFAMKVIQTQLILNEFTDLVSLTSTVFCTSNRRRKCPHKLPNLILLKSYFACHEAKTDNCDIVLHHRQTPGVSSKKPFGFPLKRRVYYSVSPHYQALSQLISAETSYWSERSC